MRVWRFTSLAGANGSIGCNTSFLPIGQEDIKLVPAFCPFVGAVDQRLSIRRELRERGESVEVRDLRESGAIDVYYEQLKFASIAVVFIGREQDSLAVRRKGGSKAGAAEIGNDFLVFPVGAGDYQFHF